VGSETIEDFAVLKKGVHYGPHSGFGWEHIWEEHKEDFRLYYEGKFNRHVNDKELETLMKEDIENALRYGEITPMSERESVVYRWNGIEVAVSTKEKNCGSIITPIRVIEMVKYKCRVLKNEIVTGGEYHPHPIEIWTTFDVGVIKLEAFMGLPRFDPEIGKEYIVDFRLMTYDFHRINIEEKMLKQITKYPGEDKYGRAWPSIPMYFIMGEIKEVERIKKEWRGREIEKYRILVDCGLIVETEVRVDKIDELYGGDYVVIIGKMFGEIVKEGDVDALPEEEKYE